MVLNTAGIGAAASRSRLGSCAAGSAGAAGAADSGPPVGESWPSPSPSPSPKPGARPSARPRPAGPGHVDPESRLAPLDGMRALAVTAVILFHASPSWATGGYFGVDLFFVLSGYLITSLLLAEWRPSGGIALRAFWSRRARRLLPALFLMLAVVGAAAALFPQVLGSRDLFGDTLATLGYVANWHFIAAHTNYFADGVQSLTAPAHLDPGHRGAVLPGLAARPVGRLLDGGPRSPPIKTRRRPSPLRTGTGTGT